MRVSVSFSLSPFLWLLKEGEVAWVLLASFTWFFVVVFVIVSLRKNENVLYQATKNVGSMHVCIHTPPSSAPPRSSLPQFLARTRHLPAASASSPCYES